MRLLYACNLSVGCKDYFSVDETVVQQLMEMGFTKEGSQRAVYHTGNLGVENAMNWIMDHMGDHGNSSFQFFS